MRVDVSSNTTRSTSESDEIQTPPAFTGARPPSKSSKYSWMQFVPKFGNELNPFCRASEFAALLTLRLHFDAYSRSLISPNSIASRLPPSSCAFGLDQVCSCCSATLYSVLVRLCPAIVCYIWLSNEAAFLHLAMTLTRAQKDRKNLCAARCAVIIFCSKYY